MSDIKAAAGGNAKKSNPTRGEVCGELYDHNIPAGVIYAYLQLGILITSKNREVMTRDHGWLVEQFDKRRKLFDSFKRPKQDKMMDEALKKYGGIKHGT